MACRDLVVGDSSGGVNLLPGGVANFTQIVEDLGVSVISQLLPNSASTSVYAISDNDPTLYALTSNNGTLQMLNSVRNMKSEIENLCVMCCCMRCAMMQLICLRFLVSINRCISGHMGQFPC
jgi:hypothetical protein